MAKKAVQLSIFKTKTDFLKTGRDHRSFSLLLRLQFYMHPKLFPLVLILVFPVTCQQTCRFVSSKQEKKSTSEIKIILVYIYLRGKLFIPELAVRTQNMKFLSKTFQENEAPSFTFIIIIIFFISDITRSGKQDDSLLRA